MWRIKTKDTIGEFASAFDMRRPNYDTTLLHKQQLNCSEKEIIHEFKNLWPIFQHGVWPQYRESVKDRHIKFTEHVLSHHTITHPHVCDLLRMFDVCGCLRIAIAPNTSPLEQSFSNLSKICYKDKNLFLSKSLETPNTDYQKVIDILEK